MINDCIKDLITSKNPSVSEGSSTFHSSIIKEPKKTLNTSLLTRMYPLLPTILLEIVIDLKANLIKRLAHTSKASYKIVLLVKLAIQEMEKEQNKETDETNSSEIVSSTLDFIENYDSLNSCPHRKSLRL